MSEITSEPTSLSTENIGVAMIYAAMQLTISNRGSGSHASAENIAKNYEVIYRTIYHEWSQRETAAAAVF